ncbi:alpha/beta hydrolase family protein [Streptomyces blattellae]|uniref:alpha/beta hydrolase family protein n=1 Tax=Streptomyces blattellae TaxID=2569855 RepID=UPI0018ACAAEF|nr:alpha/beta hydrolase [Streptomyces blattellae]
MVASGVDASAVADLLKRVDGDGEDWVNVAEEIGDRQDAYAQAELDAGHRASARYFFLSAASFYRVASYEIHDITEEKVRLNQKTTADFAKAAALFDPPLEEVNIPYHGFDMHGWIYLPKDAPEPCPIVLMIGGATGFKEEFHSHAMLMVERGLAVISIDAPGQGITRYLNGGALEVECEKGIGKIVDFIKQDPRFSKIGIYGGSAGGYYVTRTAALDHRIDACAVYAGGYNLIDMITGDERYRYYVHHFAVLLDTEDEAVKGLMSRMTMEGIAEKIECPLIMVHGDRDPLFGIEGQRRLLAEARSEDKRLVEYPSTFHGAPEHASKSFRLLADWMADHLFA